MRFAFIATEKANYPVALICRVLKVSRSGYYAWLGAAGCTTARARTSGSRWRSGAIYAESRGCYGSPRVHAELRDRAANEPDASAWRG